MDPHQYKIIEAAQKLGITVESLEPAWKMDIVRLSYQGKSTLVTLGRVFSHLNAVSDQIAANKVASKALMAELGIPVPAGLILQPGEIDASRISSFLAEHSPIVAKPLFGTDGQGIAMHLTSTEAVVQHIQSYPESIGEWLLEAQVKGEDLRLQYLAGQLIAGCIRKPCTLTGDGKSTVSELITKRNAVIFEQNADNVIVVDHQVNRRLGLADLTLESVLEAGRDLQIKDVSNMAQGGHAIDVTDQVHPKYQEYLDRLAETLGLRLFSLDVMATSPDADPDLHAHVLEFNAQPAWLHHTFSDVRQHDVPTLILKDYFNIT